jgi:hypothetical protein
MKKSTYPISSPVKTSHKKFENPRNDKKEIENFGTSKYQNKNFEGFKKKIKYPISPLVKFHTKN